jgi:hypothetical protein
MAQSLTFDPTDEGPSNEQKEAEAKALAQGEKLQKAREEDEASKWEKNDKENEEIDLIGGKFKTQDELLKAYQELEKLRTKESQEEEDSTPSEAPEEASEEANESEESPDKASPILNKAADEYKTDGKLSDESVEELAKLDSKDLIQAYVDFYSKSQQQSALQNEQLTDIHSITGGVENYNEMIQWASQNLEAKEIDSFNNVANSNNYEAIRFAVEALNGRYKGAVGYEAPLVTGKAPSDGVKPYRSQAELSRDIANPRYSTDPAFRMDVEARLERSVDLL